MDKKKKKWPYKYVSANTFEELNKLPKEELVKRVLRYDTNVKAEKKNRKNSEALKELRADISKHRKYYEESDEEFGKAKDKFDAEKERRDGKISEELESKAALEKGFNGSIANFQ